MSTPKVSVIIIFLNTARYLRQAVESVLAQTYDDWELLLVDDGSTDGGENIAMAYAEKWPHKIRALNHPGRAQRGISSTRNLGLREARGEYIAFLDADDMWVPEKLAQQAALMEQSPKVGLLFAGTRLWYSWTSGGAHPQNDTVYTPCPPRDTAYLPPQLITLLYPLGKGKPPSMSGFMMRREIVDTIGGFEERFSGMYEDQAFLVRVYLNFPVLVADACWDYYRQHPHSNVASTHSSGRYRTVRRRFLEWLGKYLADHEVTDPEVLHAYSKENWYFRHPFLGLLTKEVERLKTGPMEGIWWRCKWLLRVALMRCLSPARFQQLWARATLTRDRRLVLAVIAMRQPITQVEVEAVLPGDKTRAVMALMGLGLIDVSPKAAALGEAPQFVTTPEFLSFYRIKSLDRLASGRISEFAEMQRKLAEQTGAH